MMEESEENAEIEGFDFEKKRKKRKGCRSNIVGLVACYKNSVLKR